MPERTRKALETYQEEIEDQDTTDARFHEILHTLELDSIKVDVRESAIGVIRDTADKILLLKRANNITFGGKWCAPGGTLDPGETPEIAVLRETREETSLITTIESKIGVSRTVAPKKGRVYIVHQFKLIVIGDPYDITLSTEHTEWMYYSRLELAGVITRRIVSKQD